MTNQLLDKLLVPFSLFENSEYLPSSANTMQNFSIYETENEVTVEAHVPGIPPEHCDITYEKGTLTIRANKQEQEENKKRRYFRKASQNFVYRLAIPGTLDETKEPIASYKDGILKISFLKQKKAEPRRIEVHKQ